MKQNVMISQRLFGQLVMYFLAGRRDPALVAEITREIEWKMDAIQRRQDYSASLSANKQPRHGAVDTGEQGDS